MTTQKTYPQGLLGVKVGMTQVFTPDGESIPVTVIRTGPCYVLQVLERGNQGYEGVQLGFEPKKQSRVNKPDAGTFAAAGKGCFQHVREIRCSPESLGWNSVGAEIKVQDVFQDGDFVDVSGTSVGKGFQGVVRRFHAKGQPATRGTHEYRRHIGSVGCRKFPGRIFKNKKMPGRMGNAAVTLQNLQVVGVRPEENLLIVKGGIPGSNGGLVIVRKAKKRSARAGSN
jgi:large subunit ribosomal protein L3